MRITVADIFLGKDDIDKKLSACTLDGNKVTGVLGSWHGKGSWVCFLPCLLPSLVFHLHVAVADVSLLKDGTDEGFRCLFWMGVTVWVVTAWAVTGLSLCLSLTTGLVFWIGIGFWDWVRSCIAWL